jgi:hypothetical protein
MGCAGLQQQGSKKREFWLPPRGEKQVLQPTWIWKSIGIEQSQPISLCQMRAQVIGRSKSDILSHFSNLQIKRRPFFGKSSIELSDEPLSIPITSETLTVC